MWSRVQLKEKGKVAFRGNYWPCLLVSVILAVFVGQGNYFKLYENYAGEHLQLSGAGILFAPLSWLGKFLEPGLSLTLGYIGVWVILLLCILVFSVLEIGGCRFFIENAYEPVSAGKLLSPFLGGFYGKLVKIQFLRSLYTLLWGLLLVIPGIIKAYEYRMIPYLLADFPEFTKEEAFQFSREMMYGHKFDAFVLDMSFLGWKFLSSITFGIVGVFYSIPYEYATQAELYLVLRDNYFR